MTNVLLLGRPDFRSLEGYLGGTFVCLTRLMDRDLHLTNVTFLESVDQSSWNESHPWSRGQSPWSESHLAEPMKHLLKSDGYSDASCDEWSASCDEWFPVQLMNRRPKSGGCGSASCDECVSAEQVRPQWNPGGCGGASCDEWLDCHKR